MVSNGLSVGGLILDLIAILFFLIFMLKVTTLQTVIQTLALAG